MISHKDCDHPSTSSARAACRKARAEGQPTPKGKANKITKASAKKTATAKRSAKAAEKAAPAKPVQGDA